MNSSNQDKLIELAILSYADEGISANKIAELLSIDKKNVDNFVENHENVNKINDFLSPVNKTELPEISLAIRELAQFFLSNDMRKSALEILFRSMLVHQLLGDLQGQATDLGNIGRIFLNSNELEKAEKTLIEAKKLHEQLDDKSSIARDYANLAIIFSRQSKFNEAETKLTKALELFKTINDAAMVEVTLANLNKLKQAKNADKTKL